MTAMMAIFLLAGLVKGLIGLGLPTIAMGLLSIVMAPTSAASLLIMPSLVTNAWQLATGPAFLVLVKRLWGFMAGICIGTLFSVLPDLASGASGSEAALGAVLVLYGILGLLAKRLPPPGRAERWLSPLVGYATGCITAATGVFVIPAVPYLQSLALNKDDLVQALGLAFTTSTIALAIHLSVARQFQHADYLLSALALLPAIVGMFVGQHCRKYISEAAFRRCFFAGLIALGGYMACK